MVFSDRVLREAWRRAGGRCECTRSPHDHYGRCNEPLIWGYRDGAGRGGWLEHSRSGHYEDAVKDCQILCWDCYTLAFKPSQIKITP